MLAAAFLGGAKDRLLPASIPFRYFATASGFHILAWAALIIGADDLPGFIGGTGWVLASLHLLTLGVLVMTAIGASLQLLPMATRQPLQRKWPAKLCFWLLAPGTLLLAFGMVEGVGETSFPALYAGGIGVGGALLVFAWLTAGNLRAGRSAMPIVTGHGWAALVALPVFVALGFFLIIDFDNGILTDRQSIAASHMVLAVFGFMGLLVFGFSHILIPMFVLSRTLPVKLGWLELALAVLAIVVATAAALSHNDYLIIAAMLIGLGASAAYLWLMRSAFRTSMRKRLGLSFVVIRVSWGFLIVGLLTGLAVMLEAPIPNGMTLFGFLILAGWLLTFLTGILQRIMPFLASMHVVGKGGRPPLLSELTAEGPLIVHAVCHFAALVICSAGIVFDAPIFVKLGAISGLVGAIAFAVFAGFVMRWLRTTNLKSTGPAQPH